MSADRRGGDNTHMDERWTPPLSVREHDGRCRLLLGIYAHGDGDTLQEAADDLVDRVVKAATCFRRRGITFSSEVMPPDLRWLELLYELGGIAAGGGDVRGRIFGLR